MGLNAYLEAAESKGYVVGTTSALASIHYIKPRSGKRPVILAFGATGGAATTGDLYFMQTLGATTVSAAALSGATTIEFTADPGPSGNSLATNDYVCVGLDNGDFQFGTVAAASPLASLRFQLSGALEDDVAAGNPIYMLGIYSDTGHQRYHLTASTQSTKESDIGIVFGAGRGYPMMAYVAVSGSITGSIDYLTIGFTNK